MEAARSAVNIIKTCVRAAARRWPDAPISSWLRVADHLETTLRDAAVSDDTVGVRLSKDPSDDCILLRAILKWEPPLTHSGVEFDLTALLGRAMVIRAEQDTALHVDLINGSHTLRRASQSKGKRSRDWEMLLAIDLCSTEELNKLLQSLGPNSPCLALVVQLTEITNTSCNGPLPTQAIEPESIAFPGRHASIGSIHRQPENPPENPGADGEPGHLSAPQTLRTDDTEGQSCVPDIKRRIASADYSSFAEKLGLFHRDQLLPEDLRLVTRRLVSLLDGPDRVRSGQALLALISLITGCTDVVALNLHFAPQNTIWLDLDRQAWAWNFDAYRGHDETKLEAIYCPLPAPVAQKLSALMALATNPPMTLGELITASQHAANFDIEGFRSFLRACGDTAHPAHQGRFARSLTTVVLERTGSDMTAALVTSRFHATAPAALYYYGPTTTLVEERMSSVYQWLGLGGAARSSCGSVRQGCTKVLDDHECTVGWNSLVAAIDQARIAALSAPTHAIWSRVNQWLSLLAFGFVVQTAHRGVRLDRLTFGALYTSPVMGVIHDKDDALGERAQPRLIPWTKSVQGLLSSALECHGLASERGGESAVDADDPVFVQWTAPNEKPTALRTSHLAPIAAKYFGSEVNFGRSQWVTSLDRDDVDRWLIRALTGHARDLSRTSGAYFDVPPVVAADRLREAMEHTGHQVFGPRTVFATQTTWTRVGLTPEKMEVLPAQPGAKVPDPRTLLPPITTRTLMGWSMANRIRVSLIQGRIGASAQVLALLHLLFIDLVTDPNCALDAVLSSDSSRHFQRFGRRHGLLWERPHWVEAVWLPIQHSTWHLLQKVQPGSITRGNLIRGVCSAAEEALSCANWPNSDIDRWASLTACAQNFGRLALPPSLVAVSAIEMPAPSLSMCSLARLGGQSQDRQPTSARMNGNSHQRLSARDESLEALSKVLNKYSNQTQRLGERRKRAIECRQAIAGAHVRWTLFARFLRDWLMDELTRTRDNSPGCYQLSSLGTYLSTLTLARGKVSVLGDPDEWTQSEWNAFLDWTNQLSGSPASGETSGLCERVRHAVMALVRNLGRRNVFVPRSVFECLREQVPPIPGSSSSAVLVTHHDIKKAMQVAQAWLSESPVDALLIQIRATISHEFPSRSGDLSSLGWDCLTESDGLVIQREGYNTHKTENAIRIHRLSPTCAAAVRAVREELSHHTTARDLLLRLDGSHAAGLRDAQLAELWSSALKEATGDHKARPHSVRAAALQEIAWPDWQDRAAAWMSTAAGPQDVVEWIDQLQTDWTRTAQAAVAAGHGDLRSALGNYLAAWSLIYSMTVEALLQPLHLAPGFMRQLDVDPAALRKARSRHRKGKITQAKKDFDEWSWLNGCLIRTAARTELYSKNEINTPSPALARHQSSQAPSHARGESLVDSVLYLIVRTLGLSHLAAIEETRLPRKMAVKLEPLVPDDDTATALTRRARGSAHARGINANIKMALSTAGSQIIQWLVGLDQADLTFLRICVLRVDAPDAAFAKYQHWSHVVAALPSGLSISVRRGSAYISQDEVQFCRGLQGKLTLVIDPKIGCKPVASLCLAARDNRVMSARLTAVLKAGLFAIHQLHQKNQ